MSRTVVVGTAFVVVVVAYAVLSQVWVSARPGWYAALPRPSRDNLHLSTERRGVTRRVASQPSRIGIRTPRSSATAIASS